MYGRKAMSIPAIVLIFLFCLWVKKHIILLLIFCAVAGLVFAKSKFGENDTEMTNEGEEESEMKRKVNKQEVFEFLTKIPKGKVVTYGMVAEYLGDKSLARTVGNILKDNPDAEKYPCYKVVSWDGKLAEQYTFGGKEKQKELLIKDNITVNGYKVDLKKYKWNI